MISILKNNKHILPLLLLLPTMAGIAQTGKRNVMQEYMELRSLKGDYPYVYSSTSKGRGMVETYYYFKMDKQFVLALLNPDVDSVKERFYSTDILFESIEKKMKFLKKVKDRRNTEKASKVFLKSFNDTLIYVNQIGIRYKDLHFNHFQQMDAGMLKRINNDALLEGYKTLDFIAAFFSEQIPGKLNK